MQFIYRTRDKVWDFYEVRILTGAFGTVQGLKKVLSSRPELDIDFPKGQVTFYTHLPDGKRLLPTKFKIEQITGMTCPGKAKFESRLSQGKAGIQVFCEPCSTCISGGKWSFENHWSRKIIATYHRSRSLVF